MMASRSTPASTRRSPHGGPAFSRRSAAAVARASRARARQLRRPAPRTSQDRRAREARRRRARRHRHGDDVRSASAAGGSSRQGAAAPDDQGAADRRARQGRHPLRRRRPLHARAVAVGSRDLRAHGAGRMAARLGSMGRRQLSLRPRAQRQLQPAAHARASATASAPRRSIRSATRNSSSAAPASAGSWPRDAWTRPAALLGHPYTLAGTVVEGRHRGRELGFPTANLHDRQRADSAARRLCDDADDRRHRARGDHQHRREPDVR